MPSLHVEIAIATHMQRPAPVATRIATDRPNLIELQHARTRLIIGSIATGHKHTGTR